jgi:transcriptional regulator with XRE-family HTH domain
MLWRWLPAHIEATKSVAAASAFVVPATNKDADINHDSCKNPSRSGLWCIHFTHNLCYCGDIKYSQGQACFFDVAGSGFRTIRCVWVLLMLDQFIPDTQLGDHHSNSRWLGHALKAVRQHRSFTTSQIASQLGLALRTYERWETGDAPVTIASIVRFAIVVDCDPVALILSVFMRNPDFAVDAADNKLALMVTMILGDLHDLAGGGLQHLGKSEILRHLHTVLEALGKSAHQMSGNADQWMHNRLTIWAQRDLDMPQTRKRQYRK